MADGMENLKLTVNEDFAKKLHKQKERAELDQCKYWKPFVKVWKKNLPGRLVIGGNLARVLQS